MDPDWRLSSITLQQGELFSLTLEVRMLESYPERFSCSSVESYGSLKDIKGD